MYCQRKLQIPLCIHKDTAGRKRQLNPGRLMLLSGGVSRMQWAGWGC